MNIATIIITVRGIKFSKRVSAGEIDRLMDKLELLPDIKVEISYDLFD